MLAVMVAMAALGTQRILAANEGGNVPAPVRTATPLPSHRPSPSPESSAEPSDSESPSDPVVERAPVDVVLVTKPKAYFASEVTPKLCAAAAVQIAAGIITGDIDTGRARQLRIRQLELALTTRTDSHNGGAGPEGMAAAITSLTDIPYELRIYGSRQDALRAAAIAISSQDQPAILLAWRGAHAWVMSGYRADADPTLFVDATVSGAYVLDPWYPRVSSTWGRSDPPGTYQDAAEMKRNFLPWKRPEGRYPGRDGNYLIIVPVEAPDVDR